MATIEAEPQRYPNIIRAALETPWAIAPETMLVIQEILAMRAAGHRFTPDELEARVGDGSQRRDMVMVGDVAVIPIAGVIMPRADLMSRVSTAGTPIEAVRSAILDAAESSDVKQILLDVNSPGGQTDLVTELAADIRSARQRKPVVAIANTRAASAAYWLASQADEVVVTPSGSVGSIGVFAAHEDISGMQEMKGVKTTLVSAGKYKTETSPFEPLSDEARGYIQQRVEESYAQFTADVAKGRRVTVDTVRGGFGEGRMLGAKAAVSEGMADRVATFNETVNRMNDAIAARRRGQRQAVRQTATAMGVEPLNNAASAYMQGDDGAMAGPIAPHSTATSSAAWDGPANKARLRVGATEAYYRSAYAWQDDAADATTKAAYKFIHHEVSTTGDVGPANLSACSQGIAVLNGGRTGTTIPDSDRQGVYNHLAGHLRDAGRDPAPLQSAQTIDEPVEAEGTTLVDEAEALRDSATSLADRVSSLAEVRRGHLTVAKRDQLAEAASAIRAAADEFDALLEATNPERSRIELSRLAGTAALADLEAVIRT